MSEDMKATIQELHWEPLPGPRGAAIDDVEGELGMALPDALRRLYEVSDGGWAGDEVGVFDLADLCAINKPYRADIPSIVFFADDTGEGFLGVYLEDELATRGSVLWIDRGACIPADGIVCAASVSEFLRAAARGERPWKGSSIRDVWIDVMKAALTDSPSRWTSRGAATDNEVLDALARVWFARELASLARVANGLAIPGRGVRLYAIDAVEPVPESTDSAGRTGAVWIGEDDVGNRYAVTIIGWREPNGGAVIRVAPGQSPQDAPIIGSLPQVVIAWLNEGKES